MSQYPVHFNFPGRLVMVGFGSIGQGVLPLILRHIAVAPERIVIVTADESGGAEAQALGVRVIRQPLVRENYRRVLDGHGQRSRQRRLIPRWLSTM